ncbi:MAG: efflux RND transporter periplasmic adaptor subunit [Bacteroidota bacterium]|jgi:RND family efflux transporter MFP subunit
METKNIDLSALRIHRSQGEKDGPPKKTGLFIGIGVTIIVLVVGAILLSQKLFAPTVEVRLATVAWTSPSQSNAVLTASGYVVAQRKAAIASKATGRLMYLGVVEGDHVVKGQIIARLEDSDMRAVAAQARASLAVNEADLNAAEQNLVRQKTMLAKNLSTQADFENAEAQYLRVKASIEVAKAGVESAEVALENTIIRAPFNGTVLTKDADIGEMVVPMAASAGSKSAVVTIADMSSLQVEADVSESNIENVLTNQPCEITLDAYPGLRYEGLVAKIVPTADRSKATVMVKVAFRNYDSRVLPEMGAKVLFLTKQAEKSEMQEKPFLSIPSTAVTERNGKKVVYTVNDNSATPVVVTIGRNLGSSTEILSGITPGEKVIDNINAAIVEGVKVKIQ